MDVVNIRCAECGGVIGLQREDLGHRVRCPLCQQLFAVRAAVVAQVTPVMAAPVMARSQTVPQQTRAAPVPEARAEWLSRQRYRMRKPAEKMDVDSCARVPNPLHCSRKL